MALPLRGSIASAPDAENALHGPAPCDACRFASRCGAESLACYPFALYAKGAGEARWRYAPRQPTGERFARIFGTEAARAPGTSRQR